MRIMGNRCAGVVIGIALMSSVAVAQMPQEISYQGLVLSGTGQPVSNGTYSMTFRIYDAPTGGNVVWSETQPAVNVNRGLFNVMLGSTSPLTVPFNRRYWVGTTIGTNNEMSPRTPFASVPYSFHSMKADSAAFVGMNAIGSANIQNRAITLDKISTTGSTEGQFLVSTGTGLAWQTPSTSTGVTSLNGGTGALEIVAGNNIQVGRTGNQITVTSLNTGTINTITNNDGLFDITNPNGPTVNLAVRPQAITGVMIQDNAITGAKLAPNSITADKILNGSIQNADLANATVNINTGAGLSGGGAVPLGGTLNLTNTGVTSLTGTTNQVIVSAANGAVTLSTPQNLDTMATPVFAGLTVNGKVTSTSTVAADPGNTLVTKDYLTGLMTNVLDSTLLGTGAIGSPLGINLAGANMWVGTQTFATTSAQGDAFIASTNAGTATINAARIGTGLTDAQVMDDLTISGGTINGTPIGATTASTASFTTIVGDSLGLTGKATSASTVAADPGNTLVTKDFLTSGSLSVMTDATLTGSGMTGTPLGLNLGNANTFTGTQTFAVTAAQGDAFIASTNAGTATIDAARIGTGLTDAQVTDALTINGGTIDATAIGATTASTGTFTTIVGDSLGLTGKATSASTVAADPGNTLVTKDFLTAGNLAVTTDASLTGSGATGSPLSLNLANANTFTGTQTFATTAAQGDAFIASTNAGTATIDAARIGTGLTDAQVIDALTINGGTIDATAIGATTASTGTFTTIVGDSLGLTGKATSASTVDTDPGNTLVTKDFLVAGNLAIATDASLMGDGMAGTPLSLNLGNANTFTATQTLPTTAAQGDVLIASTNAGTATIDAARIGTGLMDAQVMDALTINGGTIDATPIGATTPSTGAFTTVQATTALGAGTTPASGTIYSDNVVMAWGDVTGAGVVNAEFGNAAVVRTGVGAYTVTLPNTPTAASTIVTLQALGMATVTRAGAVMTINTYDATGAAADIDFYFQTVGRP